MSEMTCCPLRGSDDGERASFFNEAVRIARKEHVCSECGEAIPKGAKYEHVFGVWDGRSDTYKTCMLCVEIRAHFACDEGWLYGCVWEDLAENFFPEMKAGGPCMEGLSPEAKQKLIDQRMAWLYEHDEIDDSRWEGWKPPA